MSAAVVAACLTMFVPNAKGADAPLTADQIWKHTLAVYAMAATYEDTGESVTEYGGDGTVQLREAHHFKTALNRPRQFYFEFSADPSAGGGKFVIWCEGEAFNSWWSDTRVHQAYPPGEGINAFALGSLPTKGTDVLVPALLYAQLGLRGPLLSLEELELAGRETVAGRQHYKLVGVARERYGNDYVSSERPTSVWIDERTFVVAKIVQETPSDAGNGLIDRITTTLTARIGGAPPAGAFHFTVPADQP